MVNLTREKILDRFEKIADEMGHAVSGGLHEAINRIERNQKMMAELLLHLLKHGDKDNAEEPPANATTGRTTNGDTQPLQSSDRASDAGLGSDVATDYAKGTAK